MPRRQIDLVINVDKKDIIPRFKIKQFDSVLLKITLVKDNKPYDARNKNIKLYIACNNELYEQKDSIVVNNDCISISLDENILKHECLAYAELEISDRDGNMTSSTFLFNIIEKIGEGKNIGNLEGFVEKYEKLISDFKIKSGYVLTKLQTDYDTTKNDVIKTSNDKILELEDRFNTLTSKQQQDSEVIDARAGAVSLKARLDNFDSQLEHIANITDKLENVNILQGNVLLGNCKNYIVGNLTLTKDLKLNGNNSTLENGKITISNLDEVIIENVIFSNATIYCINKVNTLKIKNCKFINCNDNAIEIWCGANKVEIINCEFDNINYADGLNKNMNNSGSSIYINTTHEVNECIIKNNISTNINGGTVFFLKADFKNIDINSNNIDTCLQRGIGFWDTKNAKGYVRNNIIRNCGVLKLAGTNQGVGCNAIYANVHLPELEIINNNIKNVYENGIEGGYKIIANNIIENTGCSPAHTTPSVEGIWFGHDDIIIKDNIIINPAGHGIYRYSESLDFKNITIVNNKIYKENLDNNTGICLRSPNNKLIENIHINGNTIENFNKAIELPSNKIYTVSIGLNEVVNCKTYLEKGGADSSGIDLTGNVRGNNIFINNRFQNWTDSSLDDWGKSNATVTKEAFENLNTVKVLATDKYNGRITQNVISSLEDYGNTFIQIYLKARGNNDIFIRTYKYDLDGTVSNPITYPLHLTSETKFETYKTLIRSMGKMKIEICNLGGAGSWFEISEIEGYIVNLK